jgi:peroxiredoxin
VALEDLTRRGTSLIIVVCLASLVLTGAFVVSADLRRWVGIGPQPEPPAYTAGETIDIDAAVYRDHPLTLVVFGRSTCPACRRAGAFYRELIADAATRGIPAWLATPLSDMTTEAAYAVELGVPETHVLHTPPGSIKLRSVPALAVVDKNGIIRHIWFSVPDELAQPAMRATIGALSGHTP